MLGLNIYLDNNLDAQKMLEVMMHDKKSSSRDLYLILIRDIAQPYAHNGDIFYKIKPDTLLAFLEDFLKGYKYSIFNCVDFLKNDTIEYKDKYA